MVPIDPKEQSVKSLTLAINCLTDVCSFYEVCEVFVSAQVVEKLLLEYVFKVFFVP